MVLAAAGLSSVVSADYCNSDTTFTPDNRATSELVLWPPGLKCTSTLADGSAVTKRSGNAAGFLAILAAGLLLVFGVAGAGDRDRGGVRRRRADPARRRPRAGDRIRVDRRRDRRLRLTHALTATLIAVAALAAGGLLEALGATWVGWTAVLLALAVMPQPPPHDDY